MPSTAEPHAFHNTVDDLRCQLAERGEEHRPHDHHPGNAVDGVVTEYARKGPWRLCLLASGESRR